MKCEACKKQIRDNFLGKIIGAYINDKGTLRAVCSVCQKTLKDKDTIVKAIK